VSLPPGVGSPTARWLFSPHFLADRLPTDLEAPAALGDLARAEKEADSLVYDLYRLPASMRAMVDAEYA
jgi:hypothetical protein